MSKISLEPNASGAGTFTLAAPNSNTNRTLTLPDEAGSVLTDVSDIEPQVKTATNAPGDAPIFACRAWVNFNGTDDASIRSFGNVSSVTDNGTGQYTVNFTTAMPDSDYAASFITRTRVGLLGVSTRGLSNAELALGDSRSSDFIDTDYIGFAVFR